MGSSRKEIYFDNSATTRVFDSVRDIMTETMTADYGNTSSLHTKAWRRSSMSGRPERRSRNRCG